MSDFIRCLVGMFAVIAPAGALAGMLAHRSSLSHTIRRGPWLGMASSTVAFLVLAAFAVLSEPVLDWLDASPENFQFAAAAAMFPLAVRLVLTGDSMALPHGLPRYPWLVPFAIPMLAGPSSIVAAISYAARFGEATLILASGLVLAITAVSLAFADRWENAPVIIVQTAARLSGGLLILIAVELAIDGVRSI